MKVTIDDRRSIVEKFTIDDRRSTIAIDLVDWWSMIDINVDVSDRRSCGRASDPDGLENTIVRFRNIQMHMNYVVMCLDTEVLKEID